MQHNFSRVTPDSQASPSDLNRRHSNAPRRFELKEGNGQRQLLISGHAQQEYTSGSNPQADIGNIGLTLHGQFEDNSFVTSLANQIPVWGYQKNQGARFAIPNSSGFHAFTTMDESGNKTGVITAALTSKRYANQRATFVRLVRTDSNNQLNGFTNKIYTTDGRVVEMTFRNHGEAPVKAAIDLDADGKFEANSLDLSTEDGKKSLSEALGPGLDPSQPNDTTTGGLEAFCQFLDLSPQAVLYRLGIGPKPAAEIQNPRKPERYRPAVQQYDPDA
jgi:hypothetical protein